jgi:CheY-like chemotaxis protein
MTDLLVVDDEVGLLEAMETILCDFGYHVEAVSSGQAALQILQAPGAHLPDLIIVDIIMPEMTGLQLFEIVRSHPNLSDIPVLFTSAFVSRERENLIAGLNNATLLFKPFEVEELLATIESISGPAPKG